MAEPVPKRVTDALPNAHKAVTYLRKANRGTLADAVETILGHVESAAPSGGGGRTRNVDTLKVVADRIRAAAAAQGVTIAEAVTAGLRDYVAGHWTPTPPATIPYGTKAEAVKLNFRVPDDLWDAVEAKAAQEPVEGRRPLKARRVALAALLERFPESAEVAPVERVTVMPWLPREEHRAAILTAAATAGTTVDAVAADYLERFLAGEWTPSPARTEGWGEAAKVKLSVSLPKTLHDQVEARLAELAADGPLWSARSPLMRMLVAAMYDQFPEATPTA